MLQATQAVYSPAPGALGVLIWDYILEINSAGPSQPLVHQHQCTEFCSICDIRSHGPILLTNLPDPSLSGSFLPLLPVLHPVLMCEPREKHSQCLGLRGGLTPKLKVFLLHVAFKHYSSWLWLSWSPFKPGRFVKNNICIITTDLCKEQHQGDDAKALVQLGT